MKKIGKFFLGLLIFISSFTWEIIQCALGLICTIYCILASMGKKVLEFRWYKGEILVFGEFNSTGVSLGRFIILDYRYKTQTIYGRQMIQYTIDHEYGHTNPADAHVFHVNLRSEEGLRCNKEELEFFLRG